MSKRLDEISKELQKNWDFTQEQLFDIRESIKDFAVECLMDSASRDSLLYETE